MRVSLAGCERLLLFQFLPLQNDHHSHRKDDDHDQHIMITTTMMTESCQERYRFLSAVCPSRPSIQGNIGAAVNMNREARKYKSKHDYTEKRAQEQINKEKNNYDSYNEQDLPSFYTQT